MSKFDHDYYNKLKEYPLDKIFVDKILNNIATDPTHTRENYAALFGCVNQEVSRELANKVEVEYCPKLVTIFVDMFNENFDITNPENNQLLNEVFPYAGEVMEYNYGNYPDSGNNLMAASRYARAMADNEYFENFCKDVELFLLCAENFILKESAEPLLKKAFHKVSQDYKPLSTIGFGYSAMAPELMLEDIPQFVQDLNNSNNGESEIDNAHCTFNLGERLQVIDDENKLKIIAEIFKIHKENISQQMTCFVAGLIDRDASPLIHSSNIIKHLPDINLDFSQATDFGLVHKDWIVKTEQAKIKTFIRVASLLVGDKTKQSDFKLDNYAYGSVSRIEDQFENIHCYFNFCYNLFNSKSDEDKSKICLERVKNALKCQITLDISHKMFKGLEIELWSKNYGFDEFERCFDEKHNLELIESKIISLERFLNSPGVNLYQAMQQDEETKSITVEGLDKVYQMAEELNLTEINSLVKLVGDKIKSDLGKELDLEVEHHV